MENIEKSFDTFILKYYDPEIFKEEEDEVRNLAEEDDILQELIKGEPDPEDKNTQGQFEGNDLVQFFDGVKDIDGMQENKKDEINEEDLDALIRSELDNENADEQAKKSSEKKKRRKKKN